MYEQEVSIVQRAIEALRSESNQNLIRELEEEQRAAATGLEWHGITSSMFKQFLSSRTISDGTRTALQEGIHAVQVIFGSTHE